jgi:hypothetical protein
VGSDWASRSAIKSSRSPRQDICPQPGRCRDTLRRAASGESRRSVFRQICSHSLVVCDFEEAITSAGVNVERGKATKRTRRLSTMQL